MQLRPSQNFSVAYVISDTQDANAYYVQAVIRDTATNTTLSTTNLTKDSNNSRRFYATIQAPSDPSNLGRFIDVTLTVYTDAAYTVKSQVYGEENKLYLVQERWNMMMGGGGGGGGESKAIPINYEKIREILEKEIKKIEKSPAFPSLSEIHKPIMEKLRKLSDVEVSEEVSESVGKKTAEIIAFLKELENRLQPKEVDFERLSPKFSNMEKAMAELRSHLLSLHSVARLLGMNINIVRKMIIKLDPTQEEKFERIDVSHLI